MAQSNPATALTESLFASFRKTSQDTLKVKRQRDAFVRKIRTHNYARTNQFDVSTRLDGLLEKFSVLNNDELAEALHARLVELMGRSTKFTPDILDFLLHLSNNPLANSNVVDLEQLIKEPKKTKSLTWDDIEEFDPINKKEWIWRSIHFTDYSSDEDELATSASTSIASETGNVEDDLPADGALETAHVADDLESSLSRAQFWHSEDNLIEITELQAIREGIFMLLGLPASLFWRVDGFIEIDKRYKISRLGYTSSQGALRFLGLLGMQVDHVRLFVQTPQHFSVVQTFQQAVEHYLTSFDHILSRHESEYISITNDRVVSMLSFTDNIKESVDPLLGLLPIISKLNTQGNQTILCLESMFDNIILLETAGQSKAVAMMRDVFLQSFAVYLKPIWRWMRHGSLDLREDIFITRTESLDKSRVWSDWFTIGKSPSDIGFPKFIKPHTRRIFSTGKSAAFLGLLDAPSEAVSRFDSSVLTSKMHSTSSLISFEHEFQDLLEDIFRAESNATSAVLHRVLDQHCGLRRVLTALRHVYFGHMGSAIDLVSAKIFDRLDTCRSDWNDQYVIGQLFRNAFTEVETVNIQSIRIQTVPGYSRNLIHHRRSVNILRGFTLTYNLPWSLGNIISKTSLVGYQRAATLLLQIRRATHSLERRSLQNLPFLDLRSYRRVRSIRHCLLNFAKTIFDHITGLVVEAGTSDLLEALDRAEDLDSMIKAHNLFVMNLQHRLLLTRALRPLRDAVTDLLDLCIRFSDVTSASQVSKDADSNADAVSFVTTRTQAPTNKLMDTDSSDEDEASDVEGYSTFSMDQDGLSHVDQIFDVENRMKRQLSFVVSGLQGLARADENPACWDILAERLDWGKQWP